MMLGRPYGVLGLELESVMNKHLTSCTGWVGVKAKLGIEHWSTLQLFKGS